MTADELPPVIDPETRRAALIHELRARLSPVCPGWPPERFTSMVERLADITLLYDGRSSTSTYDRRSTDRLVADMNEALERSMKRQDNSENE